MNSMRARVLIVDDEANFRDFLGEAIQAEGYDVFLASTACIALDRARAVEPDVVLLDQSLPDEDGLYVLDNLNRLPVAPRVIMMTAFAAYPTAVAAVKKGAFQYMQKPFEFDDLLQVLRDAVDLAPVQSQCDDHPALAELVGVSDEMRALKRQLLQISRSPLSTVLIQGESGTGKELIARAIHALSGRASDRLVSVNCAALSDSLLVSELFGHEKGAFTDARSMRKGVFEAAHRGTLLLDEVSEMGPRAQSAVLRTLESRSVTRVGGTAEIPVDVRVLAASNSLLERLVSAGQFRHDLFYRLNVVKLEVPALRNRVSDIPVLANYFCRRMAARYSSAPRTIPEGVLARFNDYTWPGNVRELRNAIERAYALNVGPEIDCSALPPEIAGVPPAFSAGLDLSVGGMNYRDAKKRLIDSFERAYLQRLLADAGGNVSQAARAAGLHRQAFQRLLSRCHVERGDFLT
jgi:two-component system, NtrC family, response regulator AtoC